MLRRLLNNVGSITLALVLAIVVWVVAANEENPIVEDVFSEGIPIEIVNQHEGTVIFGDGAGNVTVTSNKGIYFEPGDNTIFLPVVAKNQR